MSTNETITEDPIIIKTTNEPDILAFCSYCSLHTTLDNYDQETQMCLDCKWRLELIREAQDAK